MSVGIGGQIFAAVIALVAWTGLIVQFCLTYSENGSVLLSSWILLAFFTITTNVLVAVVFTCVAIGRGGLAQVLTADWIVAGTMLSIALVGVVYMLLLRGTLELSGGSVVVDKLLHYVTPLLVPIFWIFFAHKGGLTWRDPLLWATYPLAYLAYGMWRGLATGQFAYPFLDIVALGWGRTALNALLIAVAFMVCGFGIVWIDRWFGGRAG
jgi:hypothetical protein